MDPLTDPLISSPTITSVVVAEEEEIFSNKIEGADGSCVPEDS